MKKMFLVLIMLSSIMFSSCLLSYLFSDPEADEIERQEELKREETRRMEKEMQKEEQRQREEARRMEKEMQKEEQRQREEYRRREKEIQKEEQLQREEAREIKKEYELERAKELERNKELKRKYESETQAILKKTRGNAKYLENYLDNMTYMVFSDEDSSLLKSAVEMTNSYLVSRGYRVIDDAEIQKLKKDNSVVLEESEGYGISAIQWIAQKTNADVYLKIDAVTKSSDAYDSYYGSAKVSVKIFNPSTGEVLGSIPYTSQKAFSDVSSYEAESNALKSTIFEVLPIVEEQSKMMLAKAYSNGIRYELIINGTNDPRLMMKFKTELAKKVEKIRTLNLSSQQTKYSIFSFCEADEVASIVYDIAEKLHGFENMQLVMLRGKILTFTMGN